MKKQLSKLRRFFARTGARKLDATATREAIPMSYDDDDGSTRLSGAFIIVLLLHVVALVGVFAYSRMRENSAPPSQGVNTPNAPAKSAAPTVAAKTQPVAQSAPAPVEQARAAAPELPPLPPPPAVKVGRTHVVKSGETLTRIAVVYSISKSELAAANGIKNENELRVGQELTIPDAKTVKAETKPPVPQKATPDYHTVRKGENLMRIASTHGVKYEDLVKLNGIKDPKKIQENQRLKIPKK